MYNANEKLFNEIYTEYYNIVYFGVKTMLYSNVGDDITSCVQDTFMIAWEKIDELRSHGNIAGWLIKTAKNIGYNFNMKSLNHQKATDNTTEIESIPQEYDFTNEIIEDIEFERYIESKTGEIFISQLSESERHFYELKHKQKLSNMDIAQILGITPNAAASRNKRLKAKFESEFLHTEDKK